MQYPGKADWMPRRLRNGILETRSFMLGTGYRMLFGTSAWKERLTALETNWSGQGLSNDDFASQVSAFWQKSVWVCKKIIRPEPRSAMHWMHMLITEHVYTLLAEEARMAGRPARSEARKAEQWLDQRRLEQTNIATSLEQKALANALLSQILLFEEVSASVAASRGFKLPDHTEVAAWLRAELQEILQ
jgi:hypothetical protein